MQSRQINFNNKLSFFEQLPEELTLKILQELDRKNLATLAQVDKNFERIANDASLTLFAYKKANYIHPFVREVKEQLDIYQKNKGPFRKFFKCDSIYIDDLKKVYETIKNKKSLTPNDLIWFYRDCYNSLGKHCHPMHYGYNPQLSGQIYQNLRKSIDHYFPGSIEANKKRYW